MKKHSAVLSALLACAAAIGQAMRCFAKELTLAGKKSAEPAVNPFGKAGGGSGMLRRRGHSVFAKKRSMYAQPFGYYEQTIDPRHIHPRHLRA